MSEKRPTKKAKKEDEEPNVVDISVDEQPSCSSSSLLCQDTQREGEVLSPEQNQTFFQGEKKGIDVLNTDYIAMEHSFRILQETLRTKAKLILHMKANPYLDMFKLSCKPIVLEFIKELESSEENDLFNFQGSYSVRDLFHESIKLNDAMTKLIFGLFTDFSNPTDVIHLAKESQSYLFTETKEVEGDLLACMKMKNHEINAEISKVIQNANLEITKKIMDFSLYYRRD